MTKVLPLKDIGLIQYLEKIRNKFSLNILFKSNLLFMSGGAYSAGDLELGRSHAPMEGSLIELGDIGLICLESFDSLVPPSL